jgi:uncharacterized membrane protein
MTALNQPAACEDMFTTYTHMLLVSAALWPFLQRHYFTGLGSKLVDATLRPWLLHILPNKHHKQALSAANVLAAFFMSALLHEYIVYGGFGATPGKQFAFFMLHGLAAVAEGVLTKLLPGAAAKSPVWVGRVWAIGLTALTAPLMMDPIMNKGYLTNPESSGVVGAVVSAVARMVAHWAGVCSRTSSATLSRAY